MNNIKHHLRVWGLGLSLACVAFCAMANRVSIPAAAPADGGAYVERSFDQGRLDGYRSNPKYQYQRDNPEPPKRKPRKPKERRRIAESRPVHFDGPRMELTGLGKAILWTVIIGAVGFLLFNLLKVDWKFLWKKKSDKAKVIAEKEIPIEEDVTKMEFEDPLQKAIDAGQFRIAVRLLYLRALRQLSDQSQIVWRREKTNHDYIRELRDRNLRPAFSDVTIIFEYIWYGEVPVNKDDFNIARASFIQFEQTLRQSHAV